MSVTVRPLAEGDLDAADRIMRVAFGTIRGAPDPSTEFGDREYVRTRFRAAPGCAWAAELDGEIVGSVFAARWGTFGFFGPLTTHPDAWDRGVGGALLAPVLEAFDRWQLRQAALFTFSNSAKHLGLYRKHGFWPRFLTVVAAKQVTGPARECATFSQAPGPEALAAVRELTGAVFPGLDLERELVAVQEQQLGDTVLLRDEGLAICHCGAGSEAGSGVCYVKFAAVRPGAGAGERFERLLDACEGFAAAAGLGRLVAGVNTGRRDAYHRLMQRGFRVETIGVSMLLHPGGPDFDGPGDYVLDDRR